MIAEAIGLGTLLGGTLLTGLAVVKKIRSRRKEKKKQAEEEKSAGRQKSGGEPLRTMSELFGCKA